jgi:hypothetical protein
MKLILNPVRKKLNYPRGYDRVQLNAPLAKDPTLLITSSAALLILSCTSPTQESELNVAAAASLNEVFQVLAQSFKQESGITFVPSLAATGQLAQQIQSQQSLRHSF